MRLLLVEDDDLLADSLSEVLEDEGYRVDVAGLMREAEALMASEEYSLVILDLGLPDGSGLDLLGRWRRGGRSLPILALTVFAAVLIWVRHHQNIARLLKGEEPRIGAKKA